MNKYNINDKVYCLLNYELVEATIKWISLNWDQLLYEIELDWLRFDVYEFELGKTKEELKTELKKKIKNLQEVLDALNK